jgi:hypothetical protein
MSVKTAGFELFCFYWQVEVLDVNRQYRQFRYYRTQTQHPRKAEQH